MSQPAKNSLSISGEQLSQILHQHQQQHPIQDYSAQTYDPSAYYHQQQQQQQQQQNPNYAYYQPHYPQAYQGNYQAAPVQGGQIGDHGYSAYPGAYSDQGLGQFIGPVAQPANVGSGSRGGRPNRGRGGGNFRGRGRGRGRSSFNHVSQNGPSTGSVAEPTANNHGEQQPKLIGPSKPPGQTFHCELCKIDCTALDLLNQHKNGKKHKKNLEKAGLPVAVSTESVAEKTFQEIPKTETAGLDNTPSDKPAEAVNQSGDQKRGTKRKMRGGRNGKSTRRANEQPKVVIPIICELCFVKCDTQEVYERHVAGKKHNSKLKRYEGHHNMYGPEGLQVLYPPMAQKLVNAQDPQQVYPGPQESVPQPEQYMPPPHYTADPSATGIESGFQQNPGYTVPGPNLK